MTDDLVKELRFWNGGHMSKEKMTKAADRIEQLEYGNKDWHHICDRYDDEVERLSDRIEQLESALRAIIVHCEIPEPPNAEALKLFARAALAGEKKDD